MAAALSVGTLTIVTTTAGVPAGAAATHHSTARHVTAQRAKKSPIPLGVICSCTGPEASSLAYGPPGVRAWVKWTNAHHGIAGHPIELVVKDDDANPGTSLSEVEGMVSKSHIVALIDISNMESSWAQYVQQHHVPVVGQDLSSSFFYTNPDFFPMGMTYDVLAPAMISAAKRVGKSKFSVLYCSEAAVCQQLVQPIRGATKAAGMQLVYSSGISSSAPSYTAQCLAAKQAGADSMFVAEAASVVTAVAASCAQQGYTPVQVANDGSVAKSWQTAPGMEGMIAIEPVVPFFVHSTPATKAMYRALRTYEPGLLQSSNFQDATVESYVSAKLFGAAAKAGHLGSRGSPSAAQVLRGLYSLNGETLGGMAPPLTFNRNAPNSVKCHFWVRIQHHRFTTPYGLKTSCVS